MYSYISIMFVSFVINDDMWDFVRLGQTKRSGFKCISLSYLNYIVFIYKFSLLFISYMSSPIYLISLIKSGIFVALKQFCNGVFLRTLLIHFLFFTFLFVLFL